MHPIEREQRRLWEEIPLDTGVFEGIAKLLGLDANMDMAELVARQMTEADRHVDRYVPAMRSVRRAGVGCGFVAGVVFAEAARRAQARLAKDDLQAEAESAGMPICPTCGLRSIETRVDSHFEQATPLGPVRAAPSSSGALYGCPEGHWFRP